ncbi:MULTISPECIES: hypothetical protein [unclassified Alteromonas]|uniref:hypothetical protein n=1 Tax=unclassified Alteromonas TaxID=2614992 RepID=UPI001E46E30C|nr:MULTISPECIES: hypothetical protein [unclassified Alteromonas]
MSKYRIEIRLSPYRYVATALSVIVCVALAVISASPQTWSWVSPVGLIAFWVGAFVVGGAVVFMLDKATIFRWFGIFSNKVVIPEYTLSLSSNGIISVTNESARTKGKVQLFNTLSRSQINTDNIPMQIHSSSQMFVWGLCIEVASVKYRWFDRSHTHFAWVLKNECSEADYRRLSRAIIFAKKERLQGIK